MLVGLRDKEMHIFFLSLTCVHMRLRLNKDTLFDCPTAFTIYVSTLIGSDGFRLIENRDQLYAIHRPTEAITGGTLTDCEHTRLSQFVEILWFQTSNNQ